VLEDIENKIEKVSIDLHQKYIVHL